MSIEDGTTAVIEGSGTVPTMPAEDSKPALPDFISIVPESYRDKQWVQDTVKAENPYEALFKRFESQQELIGKKSTGIEVPAPDAPIEKIKEFHKALGVPEKPEGYEYSPPDISKEPEAVQKVLNERAQDQTFINTMRQKALEAGITPAQFKTLAAEFDGLTVAQIRAQVRGQAAAQEAAKKLRTERLSTVYGDKAPAYIAQADAMLQKAIPESIRKFNDPGLALIEALRIINEKVYKSDVVGATNAGAPEMTLPRIRQEITNLTRKPEYANKFAPGHRELVKQVDALYLEEDRMKKNRIE